MNTLHAMHTYTRAGDGHTEPFEKPVILPELDNHDPAQHAWADARFATDIMAEHGLFFALLMPEELAAKERKEALRFSGLFAGLHTTIDGMAVEDVASSLGKITDEMKRFIDYKYAQQQAQESGNLRSLVWPLFFEHTRHEAERWVRRLDDLAKGESAFDRAEVVTFWTNIMDEHARFVAHLLDPAEFELIDTAMKTSRVFHELSKGGLIGAVSATLKEPATVISSLAHNPDVDAVMSAAETILDFKTQAAREIEKAHIKSIIDPRLADHVRREALKFVDELKRTG